VNALHPNKNIKKTSTLKLGPVAAWVASLITHTQVGLQFIEETHADARLAEYFLKNGRPAFVLINPSGPAFLQRVAVPQWRCPLLD
jgi:hypothetical protein